MKILPQVQERFFDQESHQYDLNLLDNPPTHTIVEMEKIEQVLYKNKINKVIDFGSGTGRCSFYLLNKGYQVTAVDISETSLAKLKKQAHRFVENNQLRMQKNLPDKNTAMAIIGADILHHISFTEYFSKLYSSLKTEGVIIFSEPNMFNIGWYIFHFADAVVKKQNVIDRFIVEKGLLQCNYFNFVNQLKRAGFVNISINGLGLLPPPFFNKYAGIARLNYFLGDLPLLKFLAYRFIIYATKADL